MSIGEFPTGEGQEVADGVKLGLILEEGARALGDGIEPEHPGITVSSIGKMGGNENGNVFYGRKTHKLPVLCLVVSQGSVSEHDIDDGGVDTLH